MNDRRHDLAKTPGSHALVRLGEESDRAKRACERLATLGRSFEAAARRALPYLVRQRVAVAAQPTKPGLVQAHVAELRGPRHATPLKLGPRLTGLLVLDGPMVARALDGVLGGRGDIAALDEAGLSPAQIALASRVSRGLVIAFDEVLAKIGVRVEVMGDGLPEGALFVSLALRVGEGETAGHIMVVLPAAALDAGPTIAPFALSQPKTRAAVAEAEVDVVAELARVQIPLARLASLKVGDVLRLPVSIDAPARIRVGGLAVHAGRPTTSGAQIAIAIERHGD